MKAEKLAREKAQRAAKTAPSAGKAKDVAPARKSAKSAKGVKGKGVSVVSPEDEVASLRKRNAELEIQLKAAMSRETELRRVALEATEKLDGVIAVIRGLVTD